MPLIIVLESAQSRSNTNALDICNTLTDLLNFFKSFDSSLVFPISEIISSGLDATLALLLHIDFGDMKNVIENQLVALFAFFSCYHNVFIFRLYKVGIVDFMIVKFQNGLKNPCEKLSVILDFLRNLMCDSLEIIESMNNKNIFADLSLNLNSLLSITNLKHKVISLLATISNHFQFP
jgi:hypothetical protein